MRNWIKNAPIAINSSILFADSIIGAFVGVFFWSITARHYSLYSIGVASALISAANIIALVSNLGFSAVLIRYLQISGKGRLRLKAISNFIPLLFSIVGFLVFSNTSTGRTLLHPTDGSMKLSLIFLLLVIPSAVSNIQNSIYIAQQQSIFVLVSNLSGAITRFCLLIPLVSQKTSGLTASIAYGALICILTGMPSWRNKESRNNSSDLIKRDMIAYGATNYLSGLLTQLPQMLFPVIIATRISPVEAGTFNYAWLIAVILMVLSPSAANVLMAHLVDHPDRTVPLIRRTVTLFGLSLVLLAVAAYGAGTILMPLILPSYSRNVLGLLPLLLMGAVLFGMVRFQSMILAWRGWLVRLLILNGLVAIMAIGLPVVLIPRLGIMGLELGWVVSQVIGIIVGLLFYNVHRNNV